MEIYLAIITTVLVITQIIRLYQNHKALIDSERKLYEEHEIMAKWEEMVKAINKLTEEVKK